ncbi:hypothetical protein EDD15DRAFT_2205864 [Pisolithus albus]|nr:hypothetical protein EDD15DRAFT_2205864 [Pisolithus albus]
MRHTHSGMGVRDARLATQAYQSCDRQTCVWPWASGTPTEALHYILSIPTSTIQPPDPLPNQCDTETPAGIALLLKVVHARHQQYNLPVNCDTEPNIDCAIPRPIADQVRSLLGHSRPIPTIATRPDPLRPDQTHCDPTRPIVIQCDMGVLDARLVPEAYGSCDQDMPHAARASWTPAQQCLYNLPTPAQSLLPPPDPLPTEADSCLVIPATPDRHHGCPGRPSTLGEHTDV